MVLILTRALFQRFILIPALWLIKMWYKGFQVCIWFWSLFFFCFAEMVGRRDWFDSDRYKDICVNVSFSFYMVIHLVWFYTLWEIFN